MKKLNYYDASGLLAFFVIVVVGSLELYFTRPVVGSTLLPIILLVVIFSISGSFLVLVKLAQQYKNVPINIVLVLVLALSLPLFPFMFINMIEGFRISDLAIIAHIAAWMVIAVQELLSKH